MKALWTRQAQRIDALSMRERVIMFVSLAVALGALADWAVISPMLAQRAQLGTQIRKQTSEITTMRAQLAARKAQPLPDTPQGRQLATLAQLRSERTEQDQRLRGLFAGAEEMAQFGDVLERVLRRHERLTLTRFATVADAPGAARPPSGAGPGETPAIRWQGVDLSLSGRYLDLMQYLADLERAMPGLRWGELKIATKTTPPELTVRLLMAGEGP